METSAHASSVVFDRAAGRQALEGIGAGIGAVLFLGMAVLLGLGIMGGDPMIRLFGAVGFGFFGLLLGSGSIAALARASDTRLIEVGREGIWLPGMGRLPWSEVAEVRLETTRGAGGSEAPVTARFRRLGVVPHDPAIRPEAASRLAALLTGGYDAFLRRVAPDLRVGGETPAPFGVMEAEIPDRFEELLAEVRRQVPVVDAIERRARERTPRWAASPIVDLAGSERTDITTLDAAIGGPSPRSTSSTVPVAGSARSLGSVIEAVTASPGSPSATFSLPAVRLLDLIFAVGPLVSLIPAIALLLPQIQTGGLTSVVWLVIFGILVAAVFVPWLREVLRLIARLRQGREGIERLRIGPEGVWLAGADTRAWDAIREVRTERAGLIRRFGTRTIERWRLVFVPRGSGRTDATPAITSDQLDAPFDEVLDLIRHYHKVVETD
jgi:hypothetical protein